MCVSFANAGDKYWNGGGTDNLWSTSANWTPSAPGKWDNVWIDAPGAPHQPLIDSSIVYTKVFKIFLGKNEGPCTLTVTGGSLETHYNVGVGLDTGIGILDISGGYVKARQGVLMGAHDGATGTVNLSGGTLEVSALAAVGSYQNSCVIGAEGSATFNMSGGTLTAMEDIWLAVGATSSGNLNMTGGVINVADTIHIDYQGANLTFSPAAAPGAIQLDGGVINASDLVINSLGSMDLTEGRMILDGDDTEVVWGYVDAGLITGYGVANNVLVGYDSRNDKTIVVAIPEPATIALLGLGSLALLKRRRA